ncbi:hypothetical protein F4X73_19390 [Candidatus Poribacteria bacterium]|nr:hypothetical protein [Candidatus Poribacteria bacterium]MYB66855.1 hypothetical protein [Candidatus Poribacteria bacterium]
MHEVTQAIIVLTIVMVFIAVKLLQIGRTLKVQSDNLEKIARNLERLIYYATVDNRTKSDE